MPALPTTKYRVVYILVVESWIEHNQEMILVGGESNLSQDDAPPYLVTSLRFVRSRGILDDVDVTEHFEMREFGGYQRV